MQAKRTGAPPGLLDKAAGTPTAANGSGGSAAAKKELAAARKREGELAARVAALEAEAGAGAGVRAELEAAKAELESQLKVRALAAPWARRQILRFRSARQAGGRQGRAEVAAQGASRWQCPGLGIQGVRVCVRALSWRAPRQNCPPAFTLS